MKSCHYFILFTVVVCTFGPTSVKAWPRYPYSDPVVAERAELIVAAHVKEDSIEYVRHATGSSWEHHAVLIVDEVIKGTLGEPEMPIIIHYGLDPKAPGTPNFFGHSFSKDIPEKYPDPNLPIYIFDDGGMGNRVSADIRKDQLWFLRVHNWYKDKLNENDDTSTAPGIWDPQDIQPLELKPYFRAFVSGYPEDKLKEYTEGNTPLAIRSRVYLDHLKIEGIRREPDVNKQANLLLPLCLFTDMKDEGPTQREALTALCSIPGQIGAAALIPLFKDRKYQEMQSDIVYEWMKAKYLEAVPILITQLKAENNFWRKQSLHAQEDMVGKSFEGVPTDAQNMSRVRIESILYFFAHVPDTRTIPVLQETKRFWDKVAAHVDEPRNRVGDECDEALLSMKQQAEQSQTIEK